MIIIKTKTYVVLKIANAMSSKNLKTEPLMDAVECVCIKVRKGCTTKNLTCKLFTCSEVEKRCQVIKFDDLKILNLLSYRNKMILKSDYFSKREDVINDLYYGSFLLGLLESSSE